ncbi:MAG: efflux RND transporter permease subunit [Proteobacteria bacterium]|nr:efflux RND transporter permease subunit [Pseudomonadota bacterium]
MIRFFASHPTAANLLMLILFVMGFLTLPALRRETFPQFSTDRIRITVAYPGASAEEMEEAVGQRIEDAMAGITYVEEVTAESREGVCFVTVEMQEDGDIRQFIDDIRTSVDSISSFPEDAGDPVISRLGRSSHVVAVAVSGPMSVQHLKEYSEQLKRKLKQLPEVSMVNVDGFSDRQIQVLVRAQKLMKYGLSIDDIANAISAQSLDIPTGSIETKDREILLRFSDKRRTVREFENIVVIGGSSGGEIRLRDLAVVVDRFELDEAKFEFNEKRAGFVTISKSTEEDALVVYEAVKKAVEKESALAPEGVKLTVTYDMASMIEDRLQLVFRNGWQGLMLVFLAMFLFFNFRMAFWVAIGLPVSFLGAFFLMNQIGYTLNMMTTLALILSIGILMDDAIVIAENVAVQMRKGKSPAQAAIDGVSEVKNGVLASFFTTACVFLPLAYMEGMMGKVLLVIPVVLLFVLSVSLIEAFLILPHHLSHSFKNVTPEQSGRFRKRVEAGIEWCRDKVLGRVVDAAVRRRYFTVGLVLMVMLVSVAMIPSGRLKFVAFPELEGNFIQAQILLPQGTPLHLTEEVVEKVLAGIKRVDEKLSPLQKKGDKLVLNTMVLYSSNSDANESGPHLATVMVDLLDVEFREQSLAEIVDLWRQETGIQPDVISLKFGEPARGPSGTPIRIQFRGDDLNELKAASMELTEWLGQFDGVFDVFDDMRPGKPEITMKLKTGATVLGLNAGSIAGQVRSAFYGKQVNEIQVGRESYEVDVRMDSRDKDSLKDLENFHVKGAGGVKIPIVNVATFEKSRGYARIVHVDGIRTLTLKGDVNRSVTNTGEVINKLKTDFLPRFQRNYPDVMMVIRGESERTSRTTGSMSKLFMVGVIGIFILLSFQFSSFSEPLVIMMAIPFALIGVIWGHIAMGYDISMPSLLGFISLSGIVVNDSILLVEFLKKRRHEGKSATEAACIASRERFRAVLLTSLTTVAGLMPLLSETSVQAQVLIPMAISMAFGLMASTVLILVVIPCLYSIADDLGFSAKIEPAAEELVTEQPVVSRT